MSEDGVPVVFDANGLGREEESGAVSPSYTKVRRWRQAFLEVVEPPHLVGGCPSCDELLSRGDCTNPDCEEFEEDVHPLVVCAGAVVVAMVILVLFALVGRL